MSSLKVPVQVPPEEPDDDNVEAPESGLGDLVRWLLLDRWWVWALILLIVGLALLIGAGMLPLEGLLRAASGGE